MKFLVTGSTGLVGFQIVKDLIKSNYEVYSCFNQTEPQQGIPTKLNLTNPDEIKSVLKKIKPDRIIHLAALTNVDLCEIQQDLAMKINATSTKVLATEAAKHGSFFVYVSTDYVFDGKQGLKKENDSPNPLGFYGKSKFEGELSLNKLASPYCIARTSTPFGLHKTKKSFPIWIKENLELKKEIPVLIDQFTSPTYVPNLSKMLLEIATRQITGTIHTAGATRISRYDLAQLIAEKLNLDKNLIIPTRVTEMKWKAKRPNDSSLDISLANEILHEKPLTIQQGLKLLFSEFQK
jgi:dTDP-4-dehydrorhamnose reductase